MSNLANKKLAKTMSAAELMKLSFDLLHTPTILLTPAYYHPLTPWVYSAPFTDSILRFSDVYLSFKNSHVPEKLTVNDTL